jgi:electron transport complex protein RnfG
MATTDNTRFSALVTVTLVAIVAGVLITASFELSRERIVANQRAQLLATLHEVLAPDSYDNDLEASRQLIVAPELLGTREPVEVFVATRIGQPVAALFTSIAPRGYNGPIELLVGVAKDGTVTAVRVTQHRETPGLGDAIERDRSNWIEGFTGRRLDAPVLANWRVRKDGGEFDAITGATVTPRAIVEAVRNTLIYFRDNSDSLFETAAGYDASN